MNEQRAALLICIFVFLIFPRDSMEKISKEEKRKCSNDWTYFGNRGPCNWPTKFCRCTEGPQSPINIQVSKTIYNPGLGTFRLSQYYKRTIVKMVNEDNTVKLKFHGNDVKISGGGLSITVSLKNIHFHWGSKNEQGSEHTINGIRFPMEMHFVHTKAKNSEKKNSPDKTVVFSFLFRISCRDNPQMNSVIRSLKHVRCPHQERYLNNFAAADLLPQDSKQFFRYEGSLTTPPCNHSVIWYIFPDLISISDRQLAEFRHIRGDAKFEAWPPIVEKTISREEASRTYIKKNGNVCDIAPVYQVRPQPTCHFPLIVDNFRGLQEHIYPHAEVQRNALNICGIWVDNPDDLLYQQARRNPPRVSDPVNRLCDKNNPPFDWIFLSRRGLCCVN